MLWVPSVRAEEKVDPTGTWQVFVNRPGRPAGESTLRLEKAADKWVGVMMDAQGRSTPLKDAQFKDGELSFKITVARDGREFTFLYKGKVTTEAIKGNVSINLLGQNRSFDFEAKRLKGEALLPGLWKITIVLEDGNKLQPTVRLKREEKGWTGGYVGTSGKEVPTSDVQFKDGELSFRLVDMFDGGQVPVRYVGKLTGDKLGGSVTFGTGKDAATLKFQAEKINTPTAQVAGTWKLQVPFKQGQTFAPVLKLTQAGSSLSGTYQGEQGETPIADALIFGDEFTFEVNRARDGKKYKLRYQGKVAGETMKGSVEYDFDGINGFLDFEGKRISQTKPEPAKAGR
jgi:hypothetical protein